MSIKLTDTQLVLLGAAAQREDRCLVAPPTLKGGAAYKVANKLIGAGLVKEIEAKNGDPIWRRDGESGAPCALKLTAAGRHKLKSAGTVNAVLVTTLRTSGGKAVSLPPHSLSLHR